MIWEVIAIADTNVLTDECRIDVVETDDSRIVTLRVSYAKIVSIAGIPWDDIKIDIGYKSTSRRWIHINSKYTEANFVLIVTH